MRSFPLSVKAAGIGGGYGQGEVYQQGKRVGYTNMTQATIGPSLGGQTISELIVFKSADAMQRFQAGQFTLTADASAVVAKAVPPQIPIGRTTLLSSPMLKAV